MSGLFAALMACTDPSASPLPAVCEGSVEQRYDPLGSDELLMFPDELIALEDDRSPTGIRLSADPSKARWLADVPVQLGPLGKALSAATGFGRNGGVLLRFTADVGDLPEGAEGGALRLLDLSTHPATEVPFTVERGEDGSQVVVQPLVPLRPGARHGLVLSTAYEAPDGGCVRPGPVLGQLLRGVVDDPRLRSLVPRYQELLAAADLAVEQVSAANVWTVADDRALMVSAAEDITRRRWDWYERPTCRDEGAWRSCEGSFLGQDYREDGGLVRDRPWSTWAMPVTIHLPVGRGPAPLVMYGHGLGSGRGESRLLMERLAADGVAVVALDAMHHGAHPAGHQSGMEALDFLGLDLNPLGIDAIAMRAAFDQTGLDRLQVIELLRQDPDVDGDFAPDVDVGRLGYVGVSLGGLLGPALLALSPDMQAAALPVGGAHLMTFVTDMELLVLARPLFAAMVGGDDAFQAWLTVSQSAVDGSDPASWAPHVLRDRVRGDAPPHLLLPVAIADEVVPPAAGRALARAFGLPHVAPVVEEVALVGPVALAPVRGNVGGITAGFFQLDRVSSGDHLEEAHHANTPLSPECSLQWETWVRTWAADGIPQIIDPYAELGTPAM